MPKTCKVDGVVMRQRMCKDSTQVLHAVGKLCVEVIHLSLAVIEVFRFGSLSRFFLFTVERTLIADLLCRSHASMALQLPKMRLTHALLALAFPLSACRSSSSCADESFQACPSPHTVPLVLSDLESVASTILSLLNAALDSAH